MHEWRRPGHVGAASALRCFYAVRQSTASDRQPTNMQRGSFLSDSAIRKKARRPWVTVSLAYDRTWQRGRFRGGLSRSMHIGSKEWILRIWITRRLPRMATSESEVDRIRGRRTPARAIASSPRLATMLPPRRLAPGTACPGNLSSLRNPERRRWPFAVAARTVCSGVSSPLLDSLEAVAVGLGLAGLAVRQSVPHRSLGDGSAIGAVPM